MNKLMDLSNPRDTVELENPIIQHENASFFFGNLYEEFGGGSNSGGCEEFYLLGYNAVQSVESQPTVLRNIPPPFSLTLVTCLVYFSTLKMEATCSF
jgi:hypothetical protein